MTAWTTQTPFRYGDSMPYLVAPAVPAGWMSRRPQPALRSGRLLLRPWCEDDVAALIAAYAEDAIQRWHARTLESPREARELIDEWNRGWAAESAARWAVVDTTFEEVVGQTALRSIDLAEGEAEISYWVVARHRRIGVATAALDAISEWAFDQLGLSRLELHHSLLNVPSCRVAVKSGFILEGTMQEKALHTDGRHDMHLHARRRSAR